MRTLVSTGIVLLLLVGCTPSEKPKQDARHSKPGKPTPSAAKVVEPEPAPPGTPAKVESDPVPAAPQGQWWCICYQADAETGPLATTSCRELESECRDLEKRVAEGGRGIIKSSLSTSCQAVRGEHPGDALGGREAWSPSKRAGAWTSEGRCLLDGIEATDDGNEDAGEPNFDVLANEALGELRMGMTAIEVQALLGDPPTKGEIEEEGATGNYVQSWTYSDAGLTLYMSAATRRGEQSIASLNAKSPSTLQTKRGIGIGSTWAAVEKAYGDVREKDGVESGDKSSFVAGSIYGGVIFAFEAGKVSEIFMGAGAE